MNENEKLDEDHSHQKGYTPTQHGPAVNSRILLRVPGVAYPFDPGHKMCGQASINHISLSSKFPEANVMDLGELLNRSLFKWDEWMTGIGLTSMK